DFLHGRPRRVAHAPRRLGFLRHPLEPRARAGNRAAGQGLLGVRPAGNDRRPARSRRPGRARRDLPLDRADSVEPDRSRALGARYQYRELQPLVEEAREAGLGVTIHVGEEGGEAGIEEIGEVIETLRPDRIGHGILAARDPELMETLRATEIVLEICPTSNL